MDKKLPKQNLLWLIFLLIITFFIYVPFWFKKLKKSMDRAYPKDKLENQALIVLLVLNILWVILILIPGKEFLLSADILNTILALFILALSFRVRSILQKFTNTKFSGVATFFFNILYLQYKINQMK